MDGIEVVHEAAVSGTARKALVHPKLLPAQTHARSKKNTADILIAVLSREGIQDIDTREIPTWALALNAL